jgi:dihydroorotase
MAKFDLLIKNGTVVDPATRTHARRDVAVMRGRIVAVDASIPRDAAVNIYDATSQYVMPGLIDLHTHIFRQCTFWGVNADVIGARTGVTTWVDAGSSGAFTIDGFREFIVRPAAVRIYAFLNISCIGLVAHDYELSNLMFCNPELFELMLNANRDLVVGGKVRLGAGTVGENGFEPLRLARSVLDRCELPVMLHVAQRPPHPEEFADLLREGDVLTHCFTGLTMRLVDEDGRLYPFARQWIDRGVLLDIGHGTGSLAFRTAEAMLAAGIKPNFISSDIHQNSMRGPAYDLPTCLSKFLSLGMNLDDVIACATSHPARFLGLEREIGTLQPGACADVAVYELASEPVDFYDAHWQVRRGDKILRHKATFAGGRLLQRSEDDPPPRHLEWKRGGRDAELYRKQAEARERAAQLAKTAGQRAKAGGVAP